MNTYVRFSVLPFFYVYAAELTRLLGESPSPALNNLVLCHIFFPPCLFFLPAFVPCR